MHCCSPNEDHVTFLVRKLVECQDGPAREGRAPPTGNEGVDDVAYEDGVREGGADDAGGFAEPSMDF